MKVSSKISFSALGFVFVFGLLGPISAQAYANPATVNLGEAANFAVLSKAAISDVPLSVITGLVGISPAAGTFITGLTCPEVNGGVGFPIHVPSGATRACDVVDPLYLTPTISSMEAAYVDAFGRTPGDMVSLSTALDGLTLTHGVYDAANLVLNNNQDVTLDCGGDSTGVFIFHTAGSLTVGSNAHVNVTGGCQTGNIFWAVAGVTNIGGGVGTESTFRGTVLGGPASSEITVTTGSTVLGRLLGEKTIALQQNIVTVPASTGTLHIVTHVINNNGGSAVAGDFTMNVAGTNVSSASFAGSETGVDVTVDAGSYAVTEPVVLAGYLESGTGTCSGTIAAGQTINCTITNDDIAPQLIVNKVVVNNNNGAKGVANFSLFLDGNSVTSGVASTTTIGLHTVSEATLPEYTSTIGGNCAADGTITLALGDVKTCTITNNDVPSSGGGGGGSVTQVYPASPFIDIVTVPNPLVLPGGPGPITYTYTLRNLGTVPVGGVTVVGDTCSPIVLAFGDANTDGKLDVSETWVYTCTTVISKTRTNTVTATGLANNISTTDIANSTVIVGLPTVPPLIHVTAVPSPLTLPAGGGVVTYIEKVTNPGIVAVANVRLVNDQCASAQYVSGDTNNNANLDTTETWTYACVANLTKTTANTVTASGQVNGLVSRDFAIATVVVADVMLPSDGLPVVSPPASQFGQQVRAIAVSLRQGHRNNNVMILQQFLISQGRGSAAQALARVGATSYFGSLTRAALAEFQASVGISPAWGNFGPITRAYLQAHY